MSTTTQHLLTAEEFTALPREGLRLELVRGEIHAMPPAFEDHGRTAMRLGVVLGQYVLANSLGEIYAAETGFLIARDPDTVRAPDAAFIQASRAPRQDEPPGWVRVMPDLVVEVVSSGDRATEVAEKMRTWLDVGVRLVWVVYPTRKVIEAHRPGQPALTLGVDDALDGYDVVPGFTAPVARVFA